MSLLRFYWCALRELFNADRRAHVKAERARADRLRRQAGEYCDHGYPWLLCPYRHDRGYRR